jgi:hypothetical protein
LYFETRFINIIFHSCNFNKIYKYALKNYHTKLNILKFWVLVKIMKYENGPTVIEIRLRSMIIKFYICLKRSPKSLKTSYMWLSAWAERVQTADCSRCTGATLQMHRCTAGLGPHRPHDSSSPDHEIMHFLRMRTAHHTRRSVVDLSSVSGAWQEVKAAVNMHMRHARVLMNQKHFFNIKVRIKVYVIWKRMKFCTRVSF